MNLMNDTAIDVILKADNSTLNMSALGNISAICAAFGAFNETDCSEMESFYEETVSFEAGLAFVIPTIFALIVIVGVIGNALVVIVALNRQMINSTNILIIGLALSDLMFLLICIPVTALDYATNTWILPEWTCSFINYCQHITAYFSVWTLMLMSLDRFLAVCYPVESMSLRNTWNTVITLCIMYTIIAISQIPVMFMHGLFEYEFVLEKRSACAYVAIAKGDASVFETRAYFGTFNVFGYLLPLTITSILYFFMLKRLWYTPRPGSSSISSSMRSRPETVRAKRKVTRLVLSVIVIWAVCWLPINICFFQSGMLYPETLVSTYGKAAVVAQISSQVLAYTNSCLNPILYALMSENFRKGFYRIFAVITNRITRGFFCNSEARIDSRMEVTHYAQTTVKRNKKRLLSRKTTTTSTQPAVETVPLQPTKAKRYVQRGLSEKTSLLRSQHHRFFLKRNGSAQICLYSEDAKAEFNLSKDEDKFDKNSVMDRPIDEQSSEQDNEL